VKAVSRNRGVFVRDRGPKRGKRQKRHDPYLTGNLVSLLFFGGILVGGFGYCGATIIGWPAFAITGGIWLAIAGLFGYVRR
jgi:hypothetical protein